MLIANITNRGIMGKRIFPHSRKDQFYDSFMDQMETRRPFFMDYLFFGVQGTKRTQFCGGTDAAKQVLNWLVGAF